MIIASLYGCQQIFLGGMLRKIMKRADADETALRRGSGNGGFGTDALNDLLPQLSAVPITKKSPHCRVNRMIKPIVIGGRAMLSSGNQ
jgi:hypothetical protein